MFSCRKHEGGRDIGATVRPTSPLTRHIFAGLEVIKRDYGNLSMRMSDWRSDFWYWSKAIRQIDSRIRQKFKNGKL